MRNNFEKDDRNAGYVRFIDEHKEKWGPFSRFLTNFHLKIIEFIDFLESDKRIGLTNFQFLWKHFHMILKNSSMHGAYHVSQIRRHPCEVILWAGLILFAAMCSILIIILFWNRYYERPTVMSIERDYTNWNVSFPPVTICGTQKINKSALYDYISTSIATDKRKLATFVQQLVNLTYDTIGDIIEYQNLPGEEFLRILEMVTYNLEANIVTNTNKPYPLKRVMTEMGICYAFNWEISQYFSPEYFLDGKLQPRTDQYKVSIFDVEKLAFLRNMLHCCEIYTHDSLDTPNTRRKLRVPEDTTTFTLLRFRAIPVVASDYIRRLRIKQRMCRYIDESNLNHFPIYTFSLCRIECKINAILKFCECIPFFYKRLPDERYCDWQGLKCVAYNRNRIKRVASICDCQSNCEDTKFIVDDFSSVFWMSPSAIRIELSNTKTRLRRNVIYKIIDALVGTGNVCNLFLGVSVLSFVEAIYFYIILLPVKCIKNKRVRRVLMEQTKRQCKSLRKVVKSKLKLRKHSNRVLKPEVGRKV